MPYNFTGSSTPNLSGPHLNLNVYSRESISATTSPSAVHQQSGISQGGWKTVSITSQHFCGTPAHSARQEQDCYLLVTSLHLESGPHCSCPNWAERIMSLDARGCHDRPAENAFPADACQPDPILNSWGK